MCNCSASACGVTRGASTCGRADADVRLHLVQPSLAGAVDYASASWLDEVKAWSTDEDVGQQRCCINDF